MLIICFFEGSPGYSKFCSCYSWRMWKDRLIIYISKILFEKEELGFHFCLLSRTKLTKRVTQVTNSWIPSVLLRNMYWLSVCFSVGISDKLSNTEVLAVQCRLLTALEVPITFFTDLFEGWPLSTFSLIPLKNSVLFINWLLSFIWKIAFFGGHGSLSLSLSIVLVKYIGIAQHGSDSAEYI